ncbi:uncharacterized protein LOC128670067 [Plodia interpunctella]|uniref:uncharacterized protein LOC128670067 n=1 Tax=Plodia interpunctella TaxID=58824 RepID=UPI002368F29E|nr:uncharacterized protein LOC128670067 [Plodia interpunctella]
MKSYIIILVLCFVCLGCGGVEGQQKTQNELEESLLAFFDIWLKGDHGSLLPLPSLNEVTVPALEGAYQDTGIKLSYSTSDMKLTGLPESYIHELVATESDKSLAVRMLIIAPSLTLSAEQYKLDGRAFYFYRIQGAGDMRVNFENSYLAVDMELATNGKKMWVEKLQFGVEVKKITINLTGASDLVRSTLNRKALSIFAKYRDEVQVSLKESVIPLLNSYLADISPDQLLEIIYGLRRKRPDSAAN